VWRARPLLEEGHARVDDDRRRRLLDLGDDDHAQAAARLGVVAGRGDDDLAGGDAGHDAVRDGRDGLVRRRPGVARVLAVGGRGRQRERLALEHREVAGHGDDRVRVGRRRDDVLADHVDAPRAGGGRVVARGGDGDLALGHARDGAGRVHRGDRLVRGRPRVAAVRAVERLGRELDRRALVDRHGAAHDDLHGRVGAGPLALRVDVDAPGPGGRGGLAARVGELRGGRDDRGPFGDAGHDAGGGDRRDFLVVGGPREGRVRPAGRRRRELQRLADENGHAAGHLHRRRGDLDGLGRRVRAGARDEQQEGAPERQPGPQPRRPPESMVR